MFAGKAGAYPSEAPLRYSTLCMLLASSTNIRLDWKGLPGTITLAYCENPQITDVKSFIKQALALPANVRLGWKKVTLTNAIAYFSP
jgi:hypothetical protein